LLFFVLLLDETGFLTDSFGVNCFLRESRGDGFLRDELLGDLDRFLADMERSRDFDRDDLFFDVRFLGRSGEDS